jgi:hypothetical protein
MLGLLLGCACGTAAKDSGGVGDLQIARMPHLERPDAPVLSPMEGSWYAWQVTSPSLVQLGDGEAMLVFAGTGHPDPDGDKSAYRLGAARLVDGQLAGVSEEPIVAQSTWDAHSQNGPTVLADGGWRMADGGGFTVWYQGRATANGLTAIGRATSTDGWTWTPDPQNPVFSLVDERLAHPSILARDDRLELFFLGAQGMHLATSTDGGASFTRHSKRPVLAAVHKTPEVIWDGYRYLASYVQADHILWAESLDGFAWVTGTDPLLTPTGENWEASQVANGQLVRLPQDTGAGPAQVEVVYVGVGAGEPRNGIGIARPVD